MKRALLTLYLASLAVFAAFSTDIYLASMPTIGQQMHASAPQVQLTLTLFFIPFAIMQLAWGPLSDHFGRKPIVISGLLIYIISSLGCAMSTTISTLILFRFTQAIGACSGTVMSLAITRDRFHNEQQLGPALRIITSVAFLGPMIAPMIGSYLLTHINWQANFYFLAAYAAALLIATLLYSESHTQSSRQPLPTRQILSSYWQQLRCKPYLLATLAVTFNFCAMFAFISASPYIYLSTFNIDKAYFGYLFAINASSLILANIFMSYLKRTRLKDQHIVVCALLISIVSTAVMLTCLKLYSHSFLSVTIPMFFTTFGIGMLYAECTAYALQHVVKQTGVASALIGTSRYGLGAFTSLLMGAVIGISITSLPMVLFGLIGLTLIFILGYFYIQ